jgi:response regulator RpfG family c-di-GMP phosphodiesterase
MSSGRFKEPNPPSGSSKAADTSSGNHRAAGISSGVLRAAAGISSGSIRVATASESHEKYGVLVVDDEPTMLLTMESLLSDDVVLVTCDTAERGLELLQTTTFHVVVSDYVLPGLNGNQLFEKVRELPEYTSCLLITGSDDYQQPRDGERHYVLLKPFDPERLVTLVMQLGRVAEMKRAVKRLGSSVGGKTG